MSQPENIVTTSISSLSSSDVIAICAVAIALIALGISIWQGYLARKHNHLSVKPHINIENTKVNGSAFTTSLNNNGIGPAFISSLSISCDGKNHPIKNHNDYKKLFNLIGIDLSLYPHVVTVFDKNTSLTQGASRSLFKFPSTEDDDELSEKLLNVLPRLSIDIKYKCIYGNTYTISDIL